MWDSVRDQLPSVFKDAMQAPKWRACLEQCRGESRALSARVNTAAVFTLRKLLKGLVCGPTGAGGKGAETRSEQQWSASVDQGWQAGTSKDS